MTVNGLADVVHGSPFKQRVLGSSPRFIPLFSQVRYSLRHVAQLFLKFVPESVSIAEDTTLEQELLQLNKHASFVDVLHIITSVIDFLDSG